MKKIIFIGLILLLQIILSIISFYTLNNNESLFNIPIVDEITNLQKADDIINLKISSDTFWQEPLYSLFLGFLKKIGINDIKKIKLFQVFFLNILITLLIFYLTEEIAPSLSIIVSFLYAINPIAIFISMTIMKTTLSIFLYTLTLLFFFKFFKKKQLSSGISFSISFILSYWTRQNIIVFLPILFFFIFKNKKIMFRASIYHNSFKKNISSKIKYFKLEIGILLFILSLICSSLLFVSFIYKKPMFTLTANGAVNFYIANNPNFEKTMNIWPGLEWMEMASQIKRGIIKPYDILKTPFQWAYILIKKTFFEFTPYPLFRQYSWAHYQKIVPYFKIAIFLNLIIISFNIFFVLRSICIFKKIKESDKIIILLYLFFHAINILFLPGIIRYNLLLIQISIILALKGINIFKKDLNVFIKNFKKPFLCSPFKMNVHYIILFFVIFASCIFIHPRNDFNQEFYDFIYTEFLIKLKKNINFSSYRLKNLMSTSLHKEAWLYLQAKQFENKNYFIKAIKLLIQISKTYKNYEILPYEIAMNYYRLKKFTMAKIYLNKAFQLKDKYAKALNLLALIAIQENNFEDAENNLLKGYNISPNNIEILNNLGNIYLEKKDYKKAKFYIKKIIKLSSGNMKKKAQYNLNIIKLLNKK